MTNIQKTQNKPKNRFHVTIVVVNIVIVVMALSG